MLELSHPVQFLQCPCLPITFPFILHSLLIVHPIVPKHIRFAIHLIACEPCSTRRPCRNRVVLDAGSRVVAWLAAVIRDVEPPVEA